MRKLRSISHALITKVVMFLIAVACLTGIARVMINMEFNEIHLSSINQDTYFESRAFADESYSIIAPLAQLIGKYKSEEYILSGKTLTGEDNRRIEEELYYDFRNSYRYNPNVSEEENKHIYQENYAKDIARTKDESMKEQVRNFYQLRSSLEAYEGIVFYASDGEHEFSNSDLTKKEQFESFDAYMLFKDYQQKLYPNEVKESQYLDYFTHEVNMLNPQTDVIYVAFKDSYLQQKISEWEKDKAAAQGFLNEWMVFLAGFIFCFVYLIIVIGRTPFDKEEIHFHVIDKLYNDLNIVLIGCLTAMWIAMIVEVFRDMYMFFTVPIFIIGLLLILSLVKHIKNRTFFQHTLLYQLFKKLFILVKHVFDSGSTGVKIVLLVIGYPLVVAATFFMFPITMGIAAWLAMRKVKSFNRIKEGVEQIKNGDLHHRIEVDGNGEFNQLAENINRITDGLKKAVDSEIKSERLKTELITNVSHDIRTPLTSIITYVDLLKLENDPKMIAEYVEVLDQKSKRLKLLTDDLFEAAKASSGSIPVQLERIDIVSLLTQGIGEMDEKIEASSLDFKLAHPTEKVYVKADGKLLWRSIENLFSNIFKYALPTSRVYIGVEDLGNEILVTFKNISAYELNISVDELMERFKRGDESRSSQGSGLGLSIAESLIHIQNGKFLVQVDGDLFKVMIYLPKFPNE
ncbi:HAMP domain-containing histidine kinase [Lysinibacillus sp. HST-98]|uniref:HAMP domain-containing sensor histidine kinase n=1 Tax=Lysinibacillus TaxID=400634 RepID=UPI0001DA53DA|nr:MULTISPECIES: HAMP domain-containing sensor histidine kinase [Lysinibacillus]EFI70013.1 histidine kinase [Lysinibacillus fusiformis ZC1]EKU44360.1 histidine kinase [Lysinibacillus fusiformis ZB2]MBL3729773.1 HAMP domain-containing histidine kinase [Lysinibacillus sp. HST-98]MBU5251567.1 HAMP domain-containing histidine kinase [Lysinibacillus capsici]MED4699959.1 HAMP domain-containing sensor histidine kinase [Lysinibacillus capsici]